MSVRDARFLETSIDSAYKEALELGDENQSRLAQLMTIWVSGYLEVSCRDVLLAYVENTSNESVTRFVSRRLRRIRRPNTSGILELVASFDEGRAKELGKFIDRKGIKDSVDSVVALRNQIAHGMSANTTITSVKTQFEDSKKLAEKLKELFAVAA